LGEKAPKRRGNPLGKKKIGFSRISPKAESPCFCKIIDYKKFLFDIRRREKVNERPKPQSNR